MGFRVLDPVHDADRWSNIVDLLPVSLRDVMFSVEFMSAQEMLGHSPRLAAYTYAEYAVVQPIIIRDIEIGGKWTGYRDVSSAVGGFGGPASNHNLTLYNWFSESFMAWCRDNKIVTEFCALNPMLMPHQKNLLISGPILSPRKVVVVIDLSMDYAAGYDGNRRRGIEKAVREGVVVAEVERSDANVEKFISLYRETMNRKKAAARWYLPDEHLRALCRVGTLMFATGLDGPLACASLMLSKGATAYYHLTANAMVEPKIRANDIMVDAVAKMAKERGCRWLHLGGGVTASPDDPVLLFKSGFSDLRRPALSYFRVFDPAIYQQLCSAKVDEEIDKTGVEFATSFEPLYRREAI